MPFVRCHGRFQPGNIADHVHFEDPEHPSFSGHQEACIFVWTRCEGEGLPRKEWDEALRSHVRDNPYQGMSHVGGVGVIEQDPQSPFEELIFQAEYEEWKLAITKANAEYWERTASRIAALNDPGRRALPEDESLGWRTRVWIASHAELTHHVPYRIDDSCRAYMRVRQAMPNGMTLQLVDLYHSSGGEPLQAAFDGLERAERCVDLLAVAGFGPAFLVQRIGTAPPFCRPGVPFEVVALQAHISHSSVQVEPEVFERSRVQETAHAPLRHLREGLSASLPTAALASFWNALERLADAEARALGLKRTVRCQKCGDERQAGWDIKGAFNSMYRRAAVDGDFDRHRSLRGRVQHGDAVFSTQPPAEFMSQLSQLQQTAVVSVSESIGLPPQTSQYILTGIPAAVFSCTPQDEEFMVEARDFQVVAGPSILPVRASASKVRRFQAGLELPPKLDPLIFPPVVAAEENRLIGVVQE